MGSRIHVQKPGFSETENKRTNANDVLRPVIKEGNKYLLYFISIFLFIHVVIVIPYKHPSKDLSIEEAKSSIESQMAFIADTLKRISDRVKVCRKDSTSYYYQQHFTYQELKLKYQKEIVDLAAKKPERTFTIPLLGISINETIVLSTYVGLILSGLFLGLLYRRKVNSILTKRTKADLRQIRYPVWAYPISIKLNNTNISSWIGYTTLVIFTHFLLIYLGLDFMAYITNSRIGSGKDSILNLEIMFLNVVLGVTVLLFYIVTIMEIIQCEWRLRNE